MTAVLQTPYNRSMMLTSSEALIAEEFLEQSWLIYSDYLAYPTPLSRLSKSRDPLDQPIRAHRTTTHSTIWVRKFGPKERIN